MSDTPEKPPVEKLQAFLDAEKITIVPTLARVEPAGAGRYVLDLGLDIRSAP